MTNSTEVHWVAGPDGRGTLNIIWSCLSTLFVCLWSSWHPDIPTERDKTILKLRLEKLSYVLGLLILPELGLIMAVEQFLAAWQCSKDLRLLGYELWTFKHCLFAEMGGVELALERRENVYTKKVYCEGLLKLHINGLLPQEPPINKYEIDQLSKSDILAKAIALLQVGWFLTQTLARLVQHLPLSQLEVVCLAYVAYAAVVYIAWWQKPFDAAVGIQFPAGATNNDKWFRTMFSHPDQSKASTRFSKWPSNSSAFGNYTLLGIFVTFLVLGGIHCISWNARFPTFVELWFWRASSLTLLIAPLLMFLTIVFDYVISQSDDDFSDSSFWTLLTVFCLFCVAKVFILVEAFISLRQAPASLYQTVDWTKYLPHVA